MGMPAAWSLLALVGLVALFYCPPLVAGDVSNALAPVDEEWGEAQEVTLTMEDIGYHADGTRNELRYVGSCWTSFMVECVRECQAFKNATLEGIRNEAAPAAAVAVLEALVEVREEICTGQCQASVSFKCSELNALHDGVEVFKYGGRWPFKMVCGIREAVSAGAALISALLCAVTFSKVLRSIALSNPSSRKGADASGSEPELNCTAEDGASCVLMMSFIGCCAFAWQAAYHVVDIRLFKYFADLSTVAAFASFCYCGLCIATGTRVPVLHPSGARVGLVLSTIPLGFLVFMGHALYQDVDMGHVPLVMRIWGVLQAVVWIWAVMRSRSPFVPVRAIIKAELLLCLGAGADALDFPPQMGLIDGHALCMLFVLGSVVTLSTPILRANGLGGSPAGSKLKDE